MLRLLAENVTLEAENKALKEQLKPFECDCENLPYPACLKCENNMLKQELNRLMEGKFTKEEVHNICHNLHGTVGPEEFADGCRKEMEKLYGFCPWVKK